MRPQNHKQKAIIDVRTLAELIPIKIRNFYTPQRRLIRRFSLQFLEFRVLFHSALVSAYSEFRLLRSRYALHFWLLFSSQAVS
jgi:hypothetical protein